MRSAYLLFLFGLPGFAHADNAALTTGGSPSMLPFHKSVVMVSELVNVFIRDVRVETECTFVFKNVGEACVVTMGFPDFGMWAEDYARTKPKSLFLRFKSFVDEKPVQTLLMLDKDGHQMWQTKQVPFAKGQTRVVKESYASQMGGIGYQVPLAAASYIIHTGSSWHGPIGKATINVIFTKPSEVQTPLSLMQIASFDALNGKAMDLASKPNGVVFAGPGKPKVKGTRLTFVKTNWRPTKADDLYLLFRFSPTAIAVEKKKAKGKT